MKIGRVGIWSMALEAQPLSVAQEAAAELDELGFPALWIPEALGKEAMSHAALLLAATRRMVVATGIANLWARDATAMVNAQRTLTEGFPERFLLGIGVSHTPTVAQRGHALVSPVQATRDYLEAMDAARYFGAPPAAPLHRVLAALGPRMLALAAELTEGAHTYTVPVAHTEQARRHLGQGPMLIPEQKVVLVSDPVGARRIGRANVSRLLRLPNYAGNLRRLGSPTRTLPTVAATGSSTRLSPGGTSKTSAAGSRSTSTRAPTTSPCRCSPLTLAPPPPCRCGSGASFPPCSTEIQSPERTRPTLEARPFLILGGGVGGLLAELDGPGQELGDVDDLEVLAWPRRRPSWR